MMVNVSLHRMPTDIATPLSSGPESGRTPLCALKRRTASQDATQRRGAVPCTAYAPPPGGYAPPRTGHAAHRATHTPDTRSSKESEIGRPRKYEPTRFAQWLRGNRGHVFVVPARGPDGGRAVRRCARRDATAGPTGDGRGTNTNSARGIAHAPPRLRFANCGSLALFEVLYWGTPVGASFGLTQLTNKQATAYKQTMLRVVVAGRYPLCVDSTDAFRKQ